jgi:hypothetical protein
MPFDLGGLSRLLRNMTMHRFAGYAPMGHDSPVEGAVSSEPVSA